MQNPIIYAWRETKGSYGLTWGTVFRTVSSVASGLGLVWAVFGWPEAMNEGALYVLYGLAAIGAGFVPLFLWNLWLAPYNIMSERLEDLASTQPFAPVKDEKTQERGPSFQ